MHLLDVVHALCCSMAAASCKLHDPSGFSMWATRAFPDDRGAARGCTLRVRTCGPAPAKLLCISWAHLQDHTIFAKSVGKVHFSKEEITFPTGITRHRTVVSVVPVNGNWSPAYKVGGMREEWIQLALCYAPVAVPYCCSQHACSLAELQDRGIEGWEPPGASHQTLALHMRLYCFIMKHCRSWRLA